MKCSKMNVNFSVARGLDCVDFYPVCLKKKEREDLIFIEMNIEDK